MPTYNFVQLLGHAGADAEVKITANNKELVTFSIATGKAPYVAWHTCCAWGKVALLAAKIKKGDLVEVHGNIKYEKYRGASKATINVCFFFLLSYKSNWDASVAQSKENREAEYESGPPSDEPEEMPF